MLHIVNHRVFPDYVRNDMCRLTEIGQQRMDLFVKERIQSNEGKFWSPMKKKKDENMLFSL